MITESEAIFLLKKHSSDEDSYNKILAHSRAVQSLALEITNKIKAKNPSVQINIDIISIGALLHDIGRFKYPPTSGINSVLHGLEGYKIIKQEFENRYDWNEVNEVALIARNHVGFGIYHYDITLQKLPLPISDYVPTTLEQKIVCYADNLIFFTRRGTIYEILKRFSNKISLFLLKRGIVLHNEIASLTGDTIIALTIPLLNQILDRTLIINRLNSSPCFAKNINSNLKNLLLEFIIDSNLTTNIDKSSESKNLLVNILFNNSKIENISLNDHHNPNNQSPDLIMNSEKILSLFDSSEYYLEHWNNFSEFLESTQHSEKLTQILKPFFIDSCLFI
ncbi:MAG: HD domain-containing protein [Nitrospiraceae bacterium]|nr:HD domain-containing protein [Nitrospiraceae bacterium]